VLVVRLFMLLQQKKQVTDPTVSLSASGIVD